MNRDELMRKIQETGFAVYDTVLFLDSHPSCRVALDFYNENKHMYESYVAEYEKDAGTVTKVMLDGSTKVYHYMKTAGGNGVASYKITLSKTMNN